MKKRHIAIVIAGLVMGAAGVAAENQDVFSLSSGDAYATPEAAQIESIPGDVAGVEVVPVEVVQVEPVQVASIEIAPVVVVSPKSAMSSTFPPSADYWKPLPVQAKYLEERAARLQVATATVRGDAFPPSAEDIIWKPLPALARYLEQKEAKTRVASYTAPAYIASASSSIE